MGKKITCRKMWGILFSISLIVCNLCMPTEYVNAAEKNTVSTTRNVQLAQTSKAKLSKTEATVVMGTTLTLTVKNLDDSKVSAVKWKANRTSIAKVSQEGVVTPVKAGKTTIKCIITYKDQSEQTLSCMVTVKDRIAAKKVTISNKDVSIKVGDSITLKAELSPANATDQIYWFSSNKAVAMVGATSGKVTAKKAGTVVVTAKVGKDKKEATAKSNKVVAEIKIKVNSKDKLENATDESFFTWIRNKDGLTITGYKNDLPEDVVIPEKIEGVIVTTIDQEAFLGCKTLNSVFIPESVTQIWSSAFRSCSNLKEVIIPETLTSIEAEVFKGCSSLCNVTIPKSVTQIGYAAFANCSSLNSVTIPKGVIQIGRHAFSECSNLKEIIIPEGITEICGYTFRGCSSLESVIIPKGVTKIGSDAFNMCSSLKEIIIPEGVTKISDSYAFGNCSSLKEILIPEGVTEIGACTFRGCSSLNSVVIPESVTEIGYGAFMDLENLEIHGKKDSYAQEFARIYRIIFIEE